MSISASIRDLCFVMSGLPSGWRRIASSHISVAMVSRCRCAFYLFIRVMEITDILSQNVPLEDVQYLAGHSNPSGHTVL